MAPSSGSSDDSGTEVEADSVCRRCEKAVLDEEPSIFCEGSCQSWYHTACANITKKQMAHIEAIKAIIVWMCPGCKSSLKHVWNEQRNCNNIFKKLEDLENKIDTMSHSNSHVPGTVPSYADVVSLSTGNKQKNNSDFVSHTKTLIIKPKKKQSRDKSTKDIKQKLNPTSAGAPIKYFYTTFDGNVIIKSDSAENLDYMNKRLDDILM